MDPIKSQRQYEHAQSKVDLLDELIVQQEAASFEEIENLKRQISVIHLADTRALDSLKRTREEIADAMAAWKKDGGNGTGE